jgi:hypothetical protein
MSCCGSSEELEQFRALFTMMGRSEPLGIEIPRFLKQPTSRVPEGPRTP